MSHQAVVAGFHCMFLFHSTLLRIQWQTGVFSSYFSTECNPWCVPCWRFSCSTWYLELYSQVRHLHKQQNLYGHRMISSWGVRPCYKDYKAANATKYYCILWRIWGEGRGGSNPFFASNSLNRGSAPLYLTGSRSRVNSRWIWELQ